MKVSTFVQRLREEFFNQLNRKTGWGKEEIKECFNQAKDKVITEMLEEEE
jgi:hypothetical protein